MSENKKTDRRVLKTKRAIKKAFIQLLGEKELNEISISEISDLADINRKTFYTYYAGVYQLVEELENEVTVMMGEIIQDETLESILRDPYPLFEKLTDMINRDMEFWNLITKTERNGAIAAKLAENLKSLGKKSFFPQANMDAAVFDVIMNISTAGLIAAYQHWFNSDRQLRLPELSRAVAVVTFTGINGAIDAFSERPEAFE